MSETINRFMMYRPESMVYHNEPQYWFNLELIRTLIPNLRTRQINALHKELNDLLSDLDIDNADWPGLRASINTIVANYK